MPAAELHAAATAALVRRGAAEEEARTQAWHLIEGDLRGHPSHGLRRLATLTARIDAGLVNLASRPVLEWARDAALSVDGDLGFGPVIAHRCLDALLERAERSGIAIAAVRRAHHIGMLSPYAEAVAARGAATILLTTSEPLVRAWGGRGAFVGTNPICIGVPSAEGPVVADASTAAVSMGRIIDHAERGAPIPDGWAVDAEGRPTTDAAAARAGAIEPFGGPKGYALGLALEAIVGLLSRTAFGADVAGTLDSTRPVTKGDLLIVIPVDALGASPAEPALAAYLDAVRGSGDGVLVPGDRARALRAERLARGVPVDARVWQSTLDLAGAA